MAVKSLTQEEYDFIYSKSPRICVDLVIQTNKGVLLTRRTISPWEGKWHLVGGRISFGESVEEACRRIAKRELNVDIKLRDFLGYMEFPNETKDRHSVSLVFLVEIIGGTLRLNHEADGVKTVKSPPKNMVPQHEAFLRSFLEKKTKHNL